MRSPLLIGIILFLIMITSVIFLYTGIKMRDNFVIWHNVIHVLIGVFCIGLYLKNLLHK